jgi:large subunit ribosomal protein L6
MSRIGKKPIQVPKGVTVTVGEGTISVKGKKGELALATRPEVGVELAGDTLQVVARDEERQSRALQGTTRALLANMILGVSQGYERKLEINGVGYEAELKGQTLVLKLGFSKPRHYAVPGTVQVETPTLTSIIIRGTDKQQVGAVAAEIRKIRKPEPYKGKGIKYAGEVIKRKAGKAFGTSS